MAERPSKRIKIEQTDYITWDEYFMGIALLSAERSKDPKRQVGACIVNNEKKIVGVGYNSMPYGCDDDKYPWGQGPEDSLDAKHLYVSHAELNAIVNKNSSDLKNCKIYVTFFPCNECAKLIIQSGIKEIIYKEYPKKEGKPKWKASKRMLGDAGVVCSRFDDINTSTRSRILLNFERERD
ncbi:Deoxycytidylate deaminase [Ooceraea biroi]|uniref:Probable deoxycytidylate deaminase n=1 Tax=Ooceraea biroi TaxID=2015173 RepID=A0A026VSW2_OOCBI|nr:Deoxycytidylate deaminase [Ooceraea biroi]